MDAYYELRDWLANAFPRESDWRRVATKCDVDVSRIDLGGSSIDAWTNILAVARAPRNLALLRDVIADENPANREPVKLLTRYEADLKAGFVPAPDFPEVRNVEIMDSDLDTVVAERALAFEETLRPDLLTMAFSGSKISLIDFDLAIGGPETKRARERLREFSTKATDGLRLLRAQQTENGLRLQRIRNEVREIEVLYEPTQPVDFRKPIYYGDIRSESRERFESEQYDEALQRYRREHDNYIARKGKLPSLRAEATQLEREYQEISFRIAQQEATNSKDNLSFEEAVAKACDRDLLSELERMIDRAGAALRGDPFKGFWTLLGAGLLGNWFASIAKEPATSGEIEASLVRGSEALVALIKQHIDDIAKSALLGPTIVDRSSKVNKVTFDNMMVELDSLPVSRFDEACERARNLVARPLPETPDRARLWDSSKVLEAKAREAGDKHTLALDLINRAKSELDVMTAMGEAVEASKRHIDAALKRISDESDAVEGLAKKSRTFWRMIERGAEIVTLPAVVRGLCTSLRREAARRLDVNLDILFSKGAAGLVDTERLSKHPFSRYLVACDELRKYLSDCEKLLAEIEDRQRELESTSSVWDVPKRLSNWLLRRHS